MQLANKIFDSRNREMRQFLHTYLAVGTEYSNISEFVTDYAENVGYGERQVWNWWKTLKPFIKKLNDKRPEYVRINVKELML